MKTKQVVLANATVLCPCCGYALVVGATVRLKATREIGQMPLMDEDLRNEEAAERYAMKEEAERHG